MCVCVCVDSLQYFDTLKERNEEGGGLYFFGLIMLESFRLTVIVAR